MKEMNFLGKLELGLQLERLVIGIEEPVLVKDLGEIKAKIDSGNGGYNVIHGEDIIYQGNYVNFLTYDGAGNPKRLNKKLVEELEVHIGGGIVQKRPVIQLDVKFANEDYKKILFSVTDRTDNSHRILISKDFVENTINALIDVGAKNISNLNYDVDYKEVNEASNEFKNVKLTDDDKVDKVKKDIEKYNKETKKKNKGSLLDRINDWANRWRPYGSSDNKDTEAIAKWKEPSKIFANYSVFYKQDQKNIQKRILTQDALKAELLKGKEEYLHIKNDKILANRLKGISIFSYLLKKGDAGPNGEGGVVIQGQEQRRELWYEFNNDTKKALKKLEERDKAEADKEAEKTGEDALAEKKENEMATDNRDNAPESENPKLDAERAKLTADVSHVNDSFRKGYDYRDVLIEKLDLGGVEMKEKSSSSGKEIDYGGSEVISKSLDATNMPKGTQGSGGEKGIFDSNRIDVLNDEAELILGLKGFIMYYIPFYAGDNKAELKSLDDQILTGAFDGDMNTFINGANVSNKGLLEVIAKNIKSFVKKNKNLIEKLPGVFAICYSDSLEKGSNRNCEFLSKESVIFTDYGDIEIDENKLKEMLGIPDDQETSEENIEELKKLLDENEEANSDSKDYDEDSVKEKLGLPDALDENEENIKGLMDILNGQSEKFEGQKGIDEGKLSEKLGIPQPIEPNDENIKGLMDTLNGKSQNQSKPKQKYSNKRVSDKLDDLLNLPIKMTRNSLHKLLKSDENKQKVYELFDLKRKRLPLGYKNDKTSENKSEKKKKEGTQRGGSTTKLPNNTPQKSKISKKEKEELSKSLEGF